MSDELQREIQSAAAILRVYEPQISEQLPKAKNGERAAGLNLLAVASGLMRAGLPLPGKLAEWISIGLEGLSAGMSPEESFGIAGRKRGERVATTNVRVSNERFLRAFLVEYFVATKGLSIESACAEVALAENVKEDLVNLAWDEHHIRAKRVLAVSLGQVYFAREVK